MVVNENVIEWNLFLDRKSQGYHYFSNTAALRSYAHTIRYPNFLSSYSEKGKKRKGISIVIKVLLTRKSVCGAKLRK